MTVEGPTTYTFESFVDVVKAAHMRGWRMAVHPKDQAEAMASLERVAEHPAWTDSIVGGPQLELHYDVPRHRIGFFDPETRTLTALLGKVQHSEKGMGRVKKLWLPGRAEVS